MGVSKLSTTQQRQLAEIGAYLQQVRLEQDRSLDEIATRTFIPMRLLKAIEQGQGDVLPEPVFVRGFIRRFGESLGLDGTAIALEFSLDDTEPSEAAPPPPVAPQQPAIADSVSSSPSPDEFSPRRERRTRSSSFPWSTAIVFSLVAIIGALLAYGLSRRAAQPELAASPSAELPSAESPSAELPVETPSAAPVAPSPSAPVAIAPSPNVLSSAAAPAPLSTPPTVVNASPTASTPVSVNLNLTDRSWLRVTVDGKVAFEGILTQGAQQSWAAQQAIVIRAGNAGAVVVAPNQGTAEPMGTPGSVATRTFTSEGLQSQ